MSTFQKILFFGLLIAVAGLVYLEATKPTPINWMSSYERTDTIPFGGKAFYELLKDKLDTSLSIIEEPPFQKLKDTSFEGTYFFINDNIGFDKAELSRLLTWVSKGNTAFISANYLGFRLKDTLGVEVQTAWLREKITTEPMLNLSNKDLVLPTPVHIEQNRVVPYFIAMDTLQQTALGLTQAYNDTLQITQPKVNFIQHTLDKGTLYLHLQPEAFSNYFLLEKEENIAYTENILAYLDTSKPVLWDAHYKSGRPLNTSPLYLLFDNKYFKWAYYFMIISVVLFVLIEGKRKQRSIPILRPHTNKTYQYTQTIAGMYIEKKDYKQIATKQVALFMEYVRTRLRVSTQNTDIDFTKNIAARSGNTLEDTKHLLQKIHNIEQKHVISEEELKELYTTISTFKTHTDGAYRNT